MRETPLEENCILKPIIQLWDIKSLWERMATEAGVQHNCSFMAKERARDNETQTEMESIPDATNKENFTATPNYGERRRKRRHFITSLVDRNEETKFRGNHDVLHGDKRTSHALLFKFSQDTTIHRQDPEGVARCYF